MKSILSYGGGVNSSALFFYILDNNMPLDSVIFADTGEEMNTTYKSVEMMKEICNNKGIDFITVKSSYGNLYDYYYKKRALPSLMRRDCTGKFKISPIRKYLRKTYGKKQQFIMYIGITYDEATRMRESDVKYIKNSYPFCDDKITRTGNIEILKRYKFIASKSGCRGCIYTKRKDWIFMLLNNYKEFERHNKLERNCRRYPEILLNDNYSLNNLKKAYKGQQKLNKFIDMEISCDVAGSCFL